MGLRDIGATLPPGFRFYPSDEELVCHYLYNKVTNEKALKGTLVEINLHTCEPWQLPEVAKLNSNEWYFFSFRDRKYATGFRTNRATSSGYWKATGKDRAVLDPTTREIVGMRKTLVLYRNRAPKGIKTGWIMHEFRLETPHMPPKEDWVLCRVFHKSKGDNSTIPTTKFSPEFTFDSAVGDPLKLAASLPAPADQSVPCEFQQMPSLSPIPPHPQSSLLNLLQLSQESHTNPIAGLSSKGDHDDYGFMWEGLNFEGNSLGDEGASNLESLRFDLDNNMVFPGKLC